MANEPLLSIIVPTRNRPELARACLGRLLEDLPEEVEIIVLENSDVPSILPQEFGNRSNVQVHSSGGALDMPSNWERGISIARGDYLAYISDKDMFLPRALRRLVQALQAGKHEILSYRKPVFCEHRNMLFYYQCNGGIHCEEFKPLLDHMFRVVHHTHSAPMIYNSAVSRRLIGEIKGTKPRFFIGNAPDVITAVLFAAHRNSYSQLDEILSVAHSGEWSNGYSGARLGGKSEKVRDFVSLFKRNPFEVLQVPIGIPSAILEVLVTAQKTYPDKLSDYGINWQRYLVNAYQEVIAMEISSQEKAEELSIFASPKCIVPRREYYKYRFASLWGKVKSVLRRRSQQILAKIKSRMCQRCFGMSERIRLNGSKAKAGEQDAAEAFARLPFWNDGHYNLQARAGSIDEALAIASASNLHLEPHARDTISV